MTWVGVEPSSLFIAPGPPFLNTKQWQRPYLKQDVVAETVIRLWLRNWGTLPVGSTYCSLTIFRFSTVFSCFLVRFERQKYLVRFRQQKYMVGFRTQKNLVRFRRQTYFILSKMVWVRTDSFTPLNMCYNG